MKNFLNEWPRTNEVHRKREHAIKFSHFHETLV